MTPPPPKKTKTKTIKRCHLGWNGNDKNQVKLNSWIIIKYLFLLSKEIKTTAENVLHFACKNGDQIQTHFWGTFHSPQFDNFLHSKFDKKVEVKVHIASPEPPSTSPCLSGETWTADAVENACYGPAIKSVFMAMETYQLPNVCNGLRNLLR